MKLFFHWMFVCCSYVSDSALWVFDIKFKVESPVPSFHLIL